MSNEELSEERKQQRLQEFRKLVEDLRDDIRQMWVARKAGPEYSYVRLQQDEEYQILYEYGDLTDEVRPQASPDQPLPPSETEFKRFYPTLDEIEELRKKRKIAFPETDTTINWKQEEDKVYVKEFFQDPEQMKADMEQLKQTPAHKIDVDQVTGELVKELPTVSRKDLERYIGENILGKVAILLISGGLLILYRYGIDQGAIHIFARVLTGIFLSTMFAVLALYFLLKKGQPSPVFNYVAAAILLYTSWLGHGEYQLVPGYVSFLVNVLLTLFLGWYAYIARSLSDVFLATIVAYYGPVAAGYGPLRNDLVFFTTEFILTAGLLTIGYLRYWRLPAVLSMAFLVSAWIIWKNDIGFYGQHHYQRWFVYGGFIFLYFYSFPLIYTARAKALFGWIDRFQVITAIAILVMAVGVTFPELLWLNGFGLVGMALVVMAIVFLLVLRKNEHAEQSVINQVNFLLVFALTTTGFFISDTDFLSSYFAFQVILLLWLGLRLQQPYLKNASFFTVGAMLFSMSLTWLRNYGLSEDLLPFIFNRAFWAGLITFFTLIASVIMLGEDRQIKNVYVFHKDFYIQVLAGIILVGVYLTGLLELWVNARIEVAEGAFKTLVLHMYNLLFVLLLRYIVSRNHIESLRVISGLLVVIVVFAYVFFAHPRVIDIRNLYIHAEGNIGIWPFLFHFFNVGLSFYLTAQLIRDIIRTQGYTSGNYSYAVWFMSIIFIVHVTFETEHIFLIVRSKMLESPYEDALDQIRLSGYSILWSLIAFGMMFGGIKLKIRELRVISLYLFAFTLVKFLLFDLSRLQTITQIISVLIIGVLLLLVSKLYNVNRMLRDGEFVLDRDRAPTQEDAMALANFFKSKMNAGKKEAQEQAPSPSATDASQVSSPVQTNQEFNTQVADEEWDDEDEFSHEEWDDESDFSDEEWNDEDEDDEWEDESAPRK